MKIHGSLLDNFLLLLNIIKSKSMSKKNWKLFFPKGPPLGILWNFSKCFIQLNSETWPIKRCHFYEVPVSVLQSKCFQKQISGINQNAVFQSNSSFQSFQSVSSRMNRAFDFINQILMKINIITLSNVMTIPIFKTFQSKLNSTLDERQSYLLTEIISRK